MAILIDADVIIQAERGLFDLAAWLESQPQEEFMLAAITAADLWYGAERATGEHRARRKSFLLQLFSLFEFVPYTEPTAFEHARLLALLDSRGQVMAPHQLILAATAIQTGSKVATFNTRHFTAVPGLTVVTPS